MNSTECLGCGTYLGYSKGRGGYCEHCKRNRNPNNMPGGGAAQPRAEEYNCSTVNGDQQYTMEDLAEMRHMSLDGRLPSNYNPYTFAYSDDIFIRELGLKSGRTVTVVQRARDYKIAQAAANQKAINGFLQPLAHSLGVGIGIIGVLAVVGGIVAVASLVTMAAGRGVVQLWSAVTSGVGSALSFLWAVTTSPYTWVLLVLVCFFRWAENVGYVLGRIYRFFWELRG